MFLHRRGETARGFAEIWSPLVSEGWTLVVPQSSEPYDSASFCWDDRERALAEVRQHIEDCHRKRGLAVEGMVMAGASQGATLALEIAAEAGLAWLCVIPSLARSFDPGRLAAVPRHTRGAVILGETDPSNSRSLAVVSSLQAAGVPVTVRTMKGIGHELPPEAVRQAGEALRELAR
jgi:predicted esterase